MGLASVKDLVDAQEKGQYRFSSWRKAPSLATNQGIWFDLSMSPGNPVPQYYLGDINTATQLKYSTKGGLVHGRNVSPQSKYLKRTLITANSATPLPMPMWLCDYLMFYGFIDESSTDEQFMVNPVGLPRYTDGKGVQMMLVCQGSHSASASLNISYTNQDGVSGRIATATFNTNASSLTGQIITTSTATANATSPFVALQGTDTGVRSVESITMLSAEVGLFHLVLVKPLVQSLVLEITAPVEEDYLLNGIQIPQIYDDAYLNWLCLPNGSLSGVGINGTIEVIYN